MTMGPEPMMRMQRMSSRLGMEKAGAFESRVRDYKRKSGTLYMQRPGIPEIKLVLAERERAATAIDDRHVVVHWTLMSPPPPPGPFMPQSMGAPVDVVPWILYMLPLTEMLPF